MVVYDWEDSWSDTEGFSLTGDGDINHALSADGYIRGTSKIYTWELDTEDVTKYSIHESINAYSTLTISRTSPDAWDAFFTASNNSLRTIEHIEDVYGNLLFRGEIR